jgi:hypothetical protein
MYIHKHTFIYVQVRQAELEQTNVELSIGITERQREISRLKLQQEQGGREDGEASIREVVIYLSAILISFCTYAVLDIDF